MRIQHWKWEYRLKDRPHILLAGIDNVLHELRLALQSEWLITVSNDFSSALSMACVVLPSRCVVDVSLPGAMMLVERLKRQCHTTQIPVIFLARNYMQAEHAESCGANVAVIADLPILDAEVTMLHNALLNTIT